MNLVDTFKNRFGVSSSSFKTTTDVDNFIEQKTGHKIAVSNPFLDICSSRSVLPIKDLNANEIFDTERTI